MIFEDIDDKSYLISRSHFLRRYDQYNKVYIVPDRTKLERTKHKKAVDELRQRRAKGESGLIIRNGIVVARQARPSNNAGSSESDVQNENQSS